MCKICDTTHDPTESCPDPIKCSNCGRIGHSRFDCTHEKRPDHGLSDSGERESFSTGAVREPNLNRGRFDLISPIALRQLAIHYEKGALKYEDRNWEKGLPVNRFLNSAIRHLQDFLEGDRSEDHVTAAAWNCFSIIHTLEMIKRGKLPEELCELPNYKELPE